MNPGQTGTDGNNLQINTRRSGYLETKSRNTCRASKRNDKEKDESTSTGAHTGRTQLAEGSEDGNRVGMPCRDRRRDAEAAGRAHRTGPRRGGAEAAADIPVVGESDGHTHPGHSSPGGWGWGTVHDSAPAGCILEEAYGRIHPWEGRPGVGIENGTGRGRDGPRRAGSGKV